MINKLNIEAFYDYFDNVANLLYENYKLGYIEGMNESFNLLLDNQVEGEYSPEDLEQLIDLKKQIIDKNFNSEEVRKAVQLGLLKGYKHTFSSNSLITPDTIGIFISYLVKKIYKTDINNVLDPVIGTGNLAYTLANHLDNDVKVYGIDNDIIKCNIARNLGDLIDNDSEIFFQDTLSYYDSGFDLIVADMPFNTDEDNYLPYQIINHHIDNLVEGGYMISVIDNDFFEQNKSDIFKSEIQQKGNIFGLVKFNESLFKSTPKSLLIIRRKGKDVVPLKDFFLVELPSFTDLDNFNKTINNIDKWFSEREEQL